jgi:hypothetical protein
MTKKQVDYLLPILRNIEHNIMALSGRIDGRKPQDWHTSEFSLVSSMGEEIAKNATFVRVTLGTLTDVENGELDR